MVRLTATLLIAFVSFFCTGLGYAQNVTPRATAFSALNAPTPRNRPTPLHTFDLDEIRVLDARLEAMNGRVAVFIEYPSTSGNFRLYYWLKSENRLVDTLEDALPNSVHLSDDGKYMIYLHDEAALNGREVNGDLTSQTVLRMYHFASGQVVNLGIPARSATPSPGETRSQFEIELDGNTLIYSSSSSSSNNNREDDAPWHIVDMQEIIYRIEGTPTPVFTPTPSDTPSPVGTATQTLTPSPTPRPSPTPTFNAALRDFADINNDGTVDPLDLLIFERFWKMTDTPTPIPPEIEN